MEKYADKQLAASATNELIIYPCLFLKVEGLMLDIAAAEEEITRWKVAAQQEADAGKAVEQEFVAQVL